MRRNYVTVKDAAKEIGVTASRVYQWIADGHVAPYRPHPKSCLLTPQQVSLLKRLPKAKEGRPRISG